MNRLTSAWRPMLLGAVLMLVLVGVAGAVPTEKPSALSAQRQYVVCAADFYPANDDTDFFNNGLVLASYKADASQWFIAPVDFPTHQKVTVDKFELFAYDNNNPGHIVATLFMHKPSYATQKAMAQLDTGASAASPQHPGTWQTTAISHNVKPTAYDAYIYVRFDDDTDLGVFGATIYYRVGW